MPILLGVVKRKVFGGGGFSQNAGGLMSLLDGQKDNIQAGMPAGFQNQLQSSGFMDQISSLGGGATQAMLLVQLVMQQARLLELLAMSHLVVAACCEKFYRSRQLPYSDFSA